MDPWPSINYTRKLFDFSSNLYYFNACWYDCELGRFSTQDPARDGVNWWIYCNGNPITYIDPTGMWINNEDGSFTAEKGDTLWGLQQETGKDWKSFDYQGEPEELQIGQRVNINNTDNNYSTVDSTSEAIKHYYNGNGSPVNLGNNSINILKNSSEFMYNKNALANGTAKSDVHRFGVDMTSQKGTYHIGDTVVTYNKFSGTKYRVVTYNAFVDDGFWDIYYNKKGDGIGTKGELPFGTPYSYVPFTWTEVYQIGKWK